MHKKPIRNTEKRNNSKVKKLLNKGAALLLTFIMVFNLVPVTGYADSSYVPNVTQIASNMKYNDAVGQTLVNLNGYNRNDAEVLYILTGYYVEPVFKHGMDPSFTLTVQVTFNDWLDRSTVIAFENSGWRMGINLKQWEKNFSFNFTDSPVVHLPAVSFTDTEFEWVYQAKSLPYNGSQQTLVNVGSFDAAYGTVTVEHRQEKDAGVYPVKVIVNLNSGIYASESSKTERGNNETLMLGRTWQEFADKTTYTKAFNVTIAKANLNISTTGGSINLGAETNYTPAELIAASGASVTTEQSPAILPTHGQTAAQRQRLLPPATIKSRQPLHRRTATTTLHRGSLL